MLIKTALRIVWHEKEQFAVGVAGVAIGVFLAVFQVGMYCGYVRNTTSVLDAVSADIWIVPKNQSTFDGFSMMDDLPYWQAKETPGVRDAARIVWGDATWRIPTTGGLDYAQVFGIDPDTSIPFRFHVDEAQRLFEPQVDGQVMVSHFDWNKLGLDERPNGPFEINGREAFVVGTVHDIRLFSTAAFVLTDMHNAQAFLRMPPSSTTYVACVCQPGVDLGQVIESLRLRMPEYDVLPAPEFRRICSNYWKTNSGIGPVILASAVLGVSAGSLIVMFLFLISVLERVPLFACMKALGATTGEIVAMLCLQVLLVLVVGAIVACSMLWVVHQVVHDSSVSILMSPRIVLLGIGMMGVCSVLAGFLSISTLFRVEPGEAFRA